MKWKIIVRDAVLIFILTVLGAALAEIAPLLDDKIAAAIVDIPVELFAGMVSIALTSIGFAISGLLTRTDRLRHLLMVAGLCWVLGLGRLFDGFSLASWFVGGIWIFSSCLAGGGVAALLSRVGVAASPGGSVSRPWGPWVSIGIAWLSSLAGGIVSLVCGFALIRRGLADQDLMHYLWGGRGTATQTGVLFGILDTLVTLAVIFWFIHLRRALPVCEYLALRPVRKLALTKWLVLVVAFKAICFLLFSALPPEIQGASVAEWSDRWSLPLYALTAISLVPITEEIIIRGFLFKGFQSSKLGDLGAVICTAILFASAHKEFSHVLILGLLLGFARLQTKSLYVPIAMHALVNYFTWVVSENFYR
jgi:hypothetical protein